MIERPGARTFPVRAAGVVIGLALALLGCAERSDPVPEDLGPRPRGPRLPQALMVRFQEVKGQGFSRESWEVEVLQFGGEVRIRGSIRSGSTSVPILDAMSPDEYAEFWEWLRVFPIAKSRPVEDPAAAPEEWRKTLQVDIVLDEETRWKSRTVWTRPLVDAVWVDEIERRLHNLALVLADREVQRQEREAVDAEPGAAGGATGPGSPAPSPGAGGLNAD